MKLLLATRNAKKLDELRRILAASPQLISVELVGLDDVPEYDEVPESGLTFAENALIKAREGVRHTGLATVADDSGIAVDALNGMPGVFSARWSGRFGAAAPQGKDVANLELLLDQVNDVADEKRGAQFVCAAAFVLPPAAGKTDLREHLVNGTMKGKLLRKPRGEGGFGYDPIFMAEGQTRSTAEMSAEEKDAISHRGQAFRALAAVIAKNLPQT
ncbi:RdgB/HAM1 family non-canonical purine NTP pyrophosphatase [Hamadaea tsunoensis]|uniref:RdgB/HAM1 family non-canonical purine NTP pyrophosphatase n=1 Tax=Hamadaea tsunoensis TaxID=53368 RepID=UPI00040E9433|nr:RdgB/HAM1 family non-canonical purine NTP pyrophosphatase [Hamadaea tsunoensis]